jgi:hypothetical protein
MSGTNEVNESIRSLDLLMNTKKNIYYYIV